MVRNPKPKRRVIEAIRRYGVECRCCGEKKIEFLQIVQSDVLEGERHDRQFNYAWLQRNRYPTGFITVCANCRWSLEELGHCPHQTDKKSPTGLLRKIKSIPANDSEVREKIIKEAMMDERRRDWVTTEWIKDTKRDTLELIAEYESNVGKTASGSRGIPESEALEVISEMHKTHAK